MSSTGTSTRTSMVFAVGGATISTGAAPPRKRATSSTGRTVADSPIRCAGRGSSASSRSRRERQVGAALGPGDRVHLVDDHRLHAAQRLPGRRGEQQEQRLGRGDEDVRRAAGEGPPLVGRGVAGAHADADVGRCHPEPVGRVADAGQRRAQVALDVDGERLERGDVEHPAPLRGLRPAARRPAGPAPRGTPPGSCRSRSARRPGRADPRSTASHAPTWAAVGSAKAASNHARVGSPNRSSTSPVRSAADSPFTVPILHPTSDTSVTPPGPQASPSVRPWFALPTSVSGR